ncbi:MAG: hypothetical protein ABSF25_01390 [Bryobacteraceae bacterium]
MPAACASDWLIGPPACMPAEPDSLRGESDVTDSKDGRFVAAQAAIDGDSVVVSIPAVPQPLFVRYAWADYPAANLTNREGLPAAPFRSDR